MSHQSSTLLPLGDTILRRIEMRFRSENQTFTNLISGRFTSKRRVLVGGGVGVGCGGTGTL